MYLHRIVLFFIILVCHFNYSAFANDSSENLNPAEKYIIEQVKKGEVANFSEKTEEDRILSADFLKKLLTGGFLHLKVTENGINIVKARIKEELDISKETISFPVSFQEAKFTEGADFSGAKFTGKANFSMAKFTGRANFSMAEFTEMTSFWKAEFTGEADFSGAVFAADALFIEAEFTGEAVFSGATFARRPNFKEAKFTEVAWFGGTQFTEGANFTGAEFTGWIHFLQAQFTGRTNFSGAEFTGRANFSQAQFTGRTDFSGADLSGADLNKANLSGVIFQPIKIPTIRNIAFADNLSKMKYWDSRQALTELREGFKNAGLRKQEREVTYAINYTHREELWEDRNSTILNKIESAFYLIFFELTCEYGMSPGQLFLILAGFIFVFTIPYKMSLSSDGEDGIWVVWISDRVRQDLGAKKPVRLTGLGFSALKVAFYFSMQSAFSIGWRELNVGSWIARMQKYEYTLRATGWVRTVSGIQSLISVYLLALWVLSFFGRPFETF